MAYRVIFRPWRARRPFYWIMAFELAGVIGLLVLFALAQPNTYRTLLWRIGYDNGFNSSPNMILYAYANHVALPKVPFVWSQTITDFNVAISVIALFVLLAKLVATIMHVYYPIVGLLVATALAGLYTASVVGQIGPDHADPRHPSNVAWYISKSCSYARPYGAYSDCQMAKASLGVTVYMLALYLTTLGLAVWSLWPNPLLDLEDDENDEDGHGRPRRHSGSDGSPVGGGGDSDKQWEMQPRTPFTPHYPQTPQTAQPLRSPRAFGGGGGGGGGHMGALLSPRSLGGFTPGPAVTGFTGAGAGAGAAAMSTPFTPRSQAFHILDRKLPLRSS